MLYESQKDFLTAGQLKAVEDLQYEPGTTIWHVRNMLVFSCCAGGMRFSDAATLEWESIRFLPPLNSPQPKAGPAPRPPPVPFRIPLPRLLLGEAAPVQYPLPDRDGPPVDKLEKDDLPSQEGPVALQHLLEGEVAFQHEFQAVAVAAHELLPAHRRDALDEEGKKLPAHLRLMASPPPCNSRPSRKSRSSHQ